MSIKYHVLGNAGSDNALLVQVDGGQSVERLLFDCGEGCLSMVPFGEILEIDHLFFSHLHMDHVSGFDSFFRCNFSRTSKPNRIWGPPQTAEIMHHRLRGFLWNLHEEMAGSWHISDIHPNEVCTTRLELTEAFSQAHSEGHHPFTKIVCEGTGFTVEAITMDHRTPSLAYIVREKERLNVDTARMAAMGLRPGPWLKTLKESGDTKGTITIGETSHSLADLRQALLVATPGDSIAYLTDFLLDETATDRLAEALRGCRVIVCEGQYRHSDLELAHKHYHMTTVLSAQLASRVGCQELILFHLSSRYERAVWKEMLAEARTVFPAVQFPAHWNVEDGV